MNRKLSLGVLFILAIFTSATYINFVSAETSGGNSSPNLSATIVISQVYGGGGGAAGTYMFDYVELFNLSNAPQSLNGLVLQYGSATGQFGSVATNIFALPNVTVAAGQHYLIQLGQAGAGGAALPVTPDVTSTNLSMAAAGGKVALANTATALGCGATATPCALPDARIIDLAAYGTSNNAEGGASAGNGTALTSTQGAVRKANGCAETDNNNNDFDVVTAPVPRNLASPATPCGGTPTPTPRGALYDFTGDGKTDWTTFRFGATTGAPIRWRVVGNPASPVPNGAFIREFEYGLTGDFIVPADYVGDRKTEMAVWRSGIYYLAQFPTGDGGITLDRAVQWGQSGDDPRSVGDYDGDGKIDYTVKRGDFVNNTVTWFIMSSSTNTMRAVRFGTSANGFLPFTFPGADFNGDGRDELVIANGAGLLGGQITYVIGDAVTGAGVATIPWGDAATDRAVAPADYTGDGIADLVAWRGRNNTAADAGVWYIRNTATGTATGTRFGIGGSDDLPVRGDYDGDGRHDIAVYRRSNQTFYALSSINNSLIFQRSGAAGDLPLGNLFVQ